MTSRSFRINCPTWRHVQVFLEPSLRSGRALALRLPFEVQSGDELTLQLVLPNDLMVSFGSTMPATATTCASMLVQKEVLKTFASSITMKNTALLMRLCYKHPTSF